MNNGDDAVPARTSTLFKVLSILFLVLQVLIIVLVLLIAFNKAKNRKIETVERKKIPVEVFIVNPKKVQDLIEIPARVEAWNSVELSAEVEGQVIFQGAKEGDKVAKDAIILKIDDSIYVAKKMRATADILKAESDMNRNTKLQELKIVSEKEMESVRNTKALAESELLIANTALEKCVIHSPIEGYLDDLPVDVGEYVNAGKLVARIEEVDKVKLVVCIPEKSVRAVKAGMEVNFIVEDGRELKGKIIFLATAADNDSLSYKVEVEVDNPDFYFRPGMIVRVKIIRKTIEDALVIPLVGVIPKYGAYFVYVANSKDMAVLREIKLAFISGHDAVLTEGLKEGEKVVIEGQHMIRENEQLRILNEPNVLNPK